MYKTHKSKHQHYDIRSDLEKIKNAFSHTARDIKQQAGDAIWSSAHNLKTRVQDTKDDFEDSVVRYVTKQPVKSLLLSMLSGFVLGYLWRRRSRK